MKKLLLIIVCLLLIGCNNKSNSNENSNITTSDTANTFAEKYNIDYSKLDLDVEIIDSDDKSITLYLPYEVKEEDVVKNYEKICDFIKTFSKKNKIYDYYNSGKEWSSSMIDSNSVRVILKTTINRKDYKVNIAKMYGLSYKGSEQTYSIYKINFLEQ
jgi:hypothetical protein